MTGPRVQVVPNGVESHSSKGNANRIVVGVPKEVKPHEYRVGLTPSAAAEYVKSGHTVLIQNGAGAGSGFTDEMYLSVGCQILDTGEEVYRAAKLIVKVKEPLASEYPLIRRDHILYTYFHFGGNEKLTYAMISSGAVCIAYETVENEHDGSLPLLVPMSEIAGRMAVQEGAKYLERPMGGSGVLLAGVPGVRPGRVLVLGGGIVGASAARVAAGIGADVVIMDVNANRLRQLQEILPSSCRTLYSTSENIAQELRVADLVIGAVLIPGKQAPHLVTRCHLNTMKPGSVIVDVAVDQGGCVETCRPTTHDQPTFVVDGIVHYCVANMPGAVPYTSTVALNNATLQYGLQIAKKGWKQACLDSPGLAKGLNIVRGLVTYKGVAEAFDLPHTPVDKLMKEVDEPGVQNGD